MSSRKNSRIVRQWLEGNGSQKEKQRLSKVLADNPEWKTFVDEMNQVDAILSESAKDQPQVDLREPIMNAIHRKETSKAAEMQKIQPVPMSTWKKIVKQLFPNSQLNIALAFVAGLIIGVAIISWFNKPDHTGFTSRWDMTGSMNGAGAQASFTLPVDLPEIKMNLSGFRLPQDYVQIAVEVTSEKISNITVTYNNSSFQVWSLRSLEQKPDCRVMSGFNFVEIGNRGQNTYSILLKKMTTMDEDLIIDIYMDGNLEFNTRLTI